MASDSSDSCGFSDCSKSTDSIEISDRAFPHEKSEKKGQCQKMNFSLKKYELL